MNRDGKAVRVKIQTPSISIQPNEAGM